MNGKFISTSLILENMLWFEEKKGLIDHFFWGVIAPLMILVSIQKPWGKIRLYHNYSSLDTCSVGYVINFFNGFSYNI